MSTEQNYDYIIVGAGSAGCAVDTISENCEVILSSGAINSPQLLMLSGIGDKENWQH